MCCNLDFSFLAEIVKGFEVNVSLCASVIALLMAMIGISLPLIINSTSKALSEYQNEYIIQMFKDEKDYKYLKNVIPWLIGVCLVAFFLKDVINQNEWIAFIVSMLIVSSAIVSVFRYIRYLKILDEIYYGNMEEPYVIRMQIKSKKEVNGEMIADKVTVQLMATDPYLSPRRALIKSSEKKGLFLAMDIADIWLGRALAGKM